MEYSVSLETAKELLDLQREFNSLQDDVKRNPFVFLLYLLKYSVLLDEYPSKLIGQNIKLMVKE